MRIGVLGGTFDPPHNGHIAIAQAAMEQLELNEVIFIPAKQNPLKRLKPTASSLDRLEMTRLAIDSKPNFGVSDQEVRREGKSYTIETLFELQAVHTADFWLIMGFDSLAGIVDWRSYERILQAARIACYYRGSASVEQERYRIPENILSVTDFIDAPRLDISSTDIRLRIQEGKPWSSLVPPSVALFINDRKLYR